jgi:hypothetical protein
MMIPKFTFDDGTETNWILVPFPAPRNEDWYPLGVVNSIRTSLVAEEAIDNEYVPLLIVVAVPT